MSVKHKIGVVVEYNPFHNGHLYQIEEIKKRYNVDLIVAILSGDYVQRGEISIINKWDKTSIALMNGVDLVVELPLYYSIQNAEVFSSEAVKILEYLELDIQVFGAEEENLIELEKVVQLQSTKEYKDLLKEYIRKGNDYNKSNLLTLKDHKLSNIMQSNNILGIEYIRSRINNGLQLRQEIIKREKVGYNDKFAVENISSATFIRSLIELKDDKAMNEVEFLVPKETYRTLKRNMDINENERKEELLFTLFKYKFLSTDKEEILKIYDIDIDIYNRISKNIIVVNGSIDFFESMKSRNLSKRRVRRILLNVLFGIEEDILKKNINKGINYVRVLGFNKKGQRYIKKLQKNKKKVFVNWKDIEKKEHSDIEREMIKIEKMGFYIKELIFNVKERLNPIVVE